MFAAMERVVKTRRIAETKKNKKEEEAAKMSVSTWS